MDKKNLFLFFGEDNFSLTEKVNHWRNEFEKKYGGDINISILEESYDANDIIQATEASPFLAEKRLVIVKNFIEKGKKEEQEIIAKKLEELPDYCVLVFIEQKAPDRRLAFYKKINKVGNLTEFKHQTDLQLAKHVQDEMKKLGGIIKFDEAKYLVFKSSADLYKVKNELKKLRSYCGEKEVTKTDIDKLVTPSLNTSIFQFTDLLSQKKHKDSIKTLHEVLESGEEVSRVFFMIVRQFRLIIQTRDMLDQGLRKPQIQSTLKEHPFVVMNTIKQSQNFNLEILKDIYRELLEIDNKVKSGQIRMLVDDNKEFLLELEQFIGKLCR